MDNVLLSALALAGREDVVTFPIRSNENRCVLNAKIGFCSEKGRPGWAPENCGITSGMELHTSFLQASCMKN
jgi:hypothetical protein